MGNNVGEKICQNRGVPQGDCMAPQLFSLFVSDLPSHLKAGTNANILMYADDIAICTSSLQELQTCLHNLHQYCTINKLTVNVKKTKILKFRKGGKLCDSDVAIYDGNHIDFVSEFNYLGVVFQPTGAITKHTNHLKEKGISAIARIAITLPLTSMSLTSLERLLYTVVIPSATYGIKPLFQAGAVPNLSYLDEVQGRLLKQWFGISKFCSTSSLLEAVGWQQISPLFHDSLQTGLSSCNMSTADTDSSIFSIKKTRRNLGMYISNGLHHLLCQSPKCFHPSDQCLCKLCNESAATKFHLPICRWLDIDNPPATINMLTINKIVTSLYMINNN